MPGKDRDSRNYGPGTSNTINSHRYTKRKSKSALDATVT